MSWLFGKKKQPANTNTSIDKMSNATSLLQKRERLLQKKIDEELQKAKDYMKRKNKTAAKLCLQRKKNYEQQIQRLHTQMMNMENMQMKLEEANMDIETLKAQRDAAKALSSIHKEIGGADKIADTMDKIRDTMDDANEISDALAQPLGVDFIDEDELDEELDMLEQEDLDEEILGMTPTPSKKITDTPSAVPGAAPAAKKVQEEDDELAALEAEMGIM